MAQLQAKVKPNPNLSPNYQLLQKKDAQKVRGKFIFHECPGGIMEFVYRKYLGDPLTPYRLKDGEITTIPLGVAKHLNTECSYPSYNYKSDEQGRPVVSISQKIRRCSFQSLEFIDLETGNVPESNNVPEDNMDQIPSALPKE